jgi:hypothetical protein
MTDNLPLSALSQPIFGLRELKSEVNSTSSILECPVKHCSRTVARGRRGQALNQEQFRCPVHNIFVSPSTFEYAHFFDNLLWNGEDDKRLLEEIYRFKRESRMARERSEDALTWNVFRYLETAGVLVDWLSSLAGTPITNPKVVYWSHQPGVGACTSLRKASQEFGEVASRGSEPDIIIECDGHFFWIESKLTSSNKTKPSDPKNTKRYLTGGANWFAGMFQSDYETIAVERQRYELMRLWLLGSWASAQSGSAFHLINIQCECRDEREFPKHIHHRDAAAFVSTTWESIYYFLAKRGEVKDSILLAYLRNKSAGYVGGKLKAAFPSLAHL